MAPRAHEMSRRIHSAAARTSICYTLLLPVLVHSALCVLLDWLGGF
jgi:hypothetical protein